MFSSLDLLRAYTAQFDSAELGPDDEFLPHEPISADAAAELVTKWKTGSVASQAEDGGAEPRVDTAAGYGQRVRCSAR